MESDDPEVLPHAAAVVAAGERYVPGPTRVTRTTRAEQAGVRGRRNQEPRVHDDPAERNQPEGQSVDAGKGHIARTDHQRDHVVAEACPHRDDPQKDHRRPVHREDLVVLLGREKRVLRLGELDPDQQGHNAADDEEEERRKQVHDRDLLVVDSRQPAEDALRLVDTGEARPRKRRVHDRHQDPPRVHDLLVGSIEPLGFPNTHDWNWFIGSATTVKTMVAWPTPHSSVHCP